MSGADWMSGLVVAALSLLTTADRLAAQSSEPPRLRATAFSDSIRIDGRLDCCDATLRRQPIRLTPVGGRE